MAKRIKLLVAALLVMPLMFAAGVDVVQAGSTLTGTVRGVVADADGNPLPGAIVLLNSDALVRERAVTTDANGNFFVPGLAPGSYTVTAMFSGFATTEQSTEVELDGTTILQFALSMGELEETVLVTAMKPVVDKTSTENSVNLNKDFTENIPTPRSYQSLLQFAPGVVGGSNPNMLGGTSNSNVYQLDGVSITDSVTGTFGANLNYDTIEAVDVKLTGVSAEYGGFQGGISNVITKSGGNDFTGSIRDEIDSASWESAYTQSTQDLFSPDVDPEDIPSIPARGARELAHDIQGAFGGPIVRNNAWFYVSYNRNETVQTQFLGNPTGGVLEDGTYIRNFQGDNSLGKLTYQVANNHKLQYTYSEDPANVPRCYGQLFWGGPCYDLQSVNFQNQGGFLWNATWDAIWGTRVLTSAKVSHWQNGFVTPAAAPLDLNTDFVFLSPGGLGAGADGVPPLTIDLSTGASFDNAVFAGNPSQRFRDQYEIKATMFQDTESMGSHTITFGVDYQEQTRIGSSIIGGNAIAYMQGWDGVDPYTDNPPVGLGGDADPYDINNRRYNFLYDFDFPGEGGPTTESTAFYIQDDWQLNDRWSFNLGVRYEANDNVNDVNEAVIKDSGIAPRLGASFDVTGEGKHIVKGTYGRYLDGIELTTISPFVRAAGGQSAYDFYVNTNSMQVPNPDEDPLDPDDDFLTYYLPGTPNWALAFGVRPDANSAGFSDDLKPQVIDEFTVAYEFSFSPTLGMKAQYVEREWKDIIGQTFTYEYPGGEPSQILFFENKDNLEREYSAVLLQVEKRFANNWALLGNYTWSESLGNVTVDTGFANYDSFAGVPQVTENRYGNLTWDVENAAKLFGSYTVPLNSERHSLTLGGAFDFRSGNPYSASQSNQTVVGPGADGIQGDPLGSLVDTDDDDQVASVVQFYEPRGSRLEDDNWALDLSFLYHFSFSRDVRFEARFEVFNVTNEQTPLAVNTGYSSDSFGYPTSYSQFQRPRNYSMNFAFLW